MSKFTDKLKEKIRYALDVEDMDVGEMERADAEVFYFIDDEEGTDLEDLMSDFDKEDQMEYFRDNKAAGVIWIECSDINAEADLKELLEEFKQKHILTKIIS